VTTETVPCGHKADFSKIKVMYKGAINKTYNFTTKTWEDSNLGGEVYTKSQTLREGVCNEVTAQNIFNLCEALYYERKKSANKKIYVTTGQFSFSTDRFSANQINNALNSNHPNTIIHRARVEDMYLNHSLVYHYRGGDYNYSKDVNGPKSLVYDYLMFSYCSATTCEPWAFFDKSNYFKPLKYENNKNKVWNFYPQNKDCLSIILKDNGNRACSRIPA
jgi:hypothetical protein